MKTVTTVLCSVSAVLLGASVVAQAPASDVDAHIAAARAAAGLEFRNTFINLCLPTSGRGTVAVGRSTGRGVGQPPDRASWYGRHSRCLGDGGMRDGVQAAVGREVVAD
jgi:hypothetical protein